MHGDGARVHGKVRGTGAERDNGPGQSAITVHGRAREGACRGPGQRAITVHGDGARVHEKVQGTGAERDNGARGRCTGAREGAGDRGRAR